MDLQGQVDAAAAEIQRIHSEEDVGQLATNLRLAGVQQRYWDLRSLLATDVNEQLACARQSAGWAEQQVRAAKTVQVDLLRDLFSKAEAMERHSSALKDLK
ncbi:hypothetical protein [Nannocystis pusilla]|uniref:hypothetical protein n=1 Tax=Nannocystis pusilla TaxID=889268 RepID=UPI003DA66AC5